MAQTYKSQFAKLLLYVRDEYMPQIEKCPQRSALQSYLEQAVKVAAFGGGVKMDFSSEGRELESGDD